MIYKLQFYFSKVSLQKVAQKQQTDLCLICEYLLNKIHLPTIYQLTKHH